MRELLSRRDDHVLGDLVQAVDEAVDRVDRSNEAHLAEFFSSKGERNRTQNREMEVQI